ncbi:ESX secretion-associated protein EspG [Mycobacteroides abscessus]|uniref:ESX secretion-associated protein EspG n=2 Tax=Mycobacteroides abscessus TaxID=36809 RepID=UPI000314F40E|nr:ESX secretion-associated protein EspG [Mycobacteroides abscessus]
MIVDAERPPMILGVDLTIDELLVIASRLDGAAENFPIVLGVTPDNILIDELREVVWADVAEKLTEKNILDPSGVVIPGVAQMIEILTRPHRTLECRWWREEHGVLVRFAIARRGNDHVIMGRIDDKIVIQRVANVGLAAMVESVIDVLPAADMEAVTGPAAALAGAQSVGDLIRFGCDSRSANTLLTATKKKTGWVHILATETGSGGHVHRVDTIAAGILDSHVGRVVSLPKTVGRELHVTFLRGTRDNLARALRELTGFLPSGTWDENSR